MADQVAPETREPSDAEWRCVIKWHESGKRHSGLRIGQPQMMAAMRIS
nr:hypothetical protein [Dongia deserti]